MWMPHSPDGGKWWLCLWNRRSIWQYAQEEHDLVTMDNNGMLASSGGSYVKQNVHFLLPPGEKQWMRRNRWRLGWAGWNNSFLSHSPGIVIIPGRDQFTTWGTNLARGKPNHRGQHSKAAEGKGSECLTSNDSMFSIHTPELRRWRGCVQPAAPTASRKGAGIGDLTPFILSPPWPRAEWCLLPFWLGDKGGWSSWCLAGGWVGGNEVYGICSGHSVS